jgi:hypothetical protein
MPVLIQNSFSPKMQSMEVVTPQPQQKTMLPNSSATLVLGILSIVLGCGFGLVLGIIGLAISKEAKQLYDKNPDAYSGYGNLNSGRVLCIIGIVLSGVSILILLLWILGITALLGTIIGLGSM